MAVKNWAWQLTHPEGEALTGESPYANQDLLIESVKASLQAGQKQSGRSPKILVIGAVRTLLRTLDRWLICFNSLGVVVRVLYSWPRMLAFLSPISSSGIWRRQRRVCASYTLRSKCSSS